MTNPLNINIKRFWKTTGVGISLLVVLLVILFITGYLLAAFPITGIGEYVVAAEKIEGTDFTLLPKWEPKHEWTKAHIFLNEAKIDNLFLSKTVNLSGALQLYGLTDLDIVVAIYKGIDGGNLNLEVTGIDVNESNFSNLQVIKLETEDFSSNVSLETMKLELVDAQLHTNFLTAEQIHLNPLGIRIHLNN